MPLKILLFFLFLTQSILAQEVNISGVVLNKDGYSIDNTSVILHDNKKSIITYAFTKSDGKFSLEAFVNSSSYYILTISSLGYEKVTDTIKIKQNKSEDIFLKFILNEKIEQLTEVLLKPDEKIIRENNKIIYKVDAFKNNTEQTVEDILKKLPGIEVLENGTIKAHGRHIDKLLIEGEDMFDKNYTILSKNLDAKVLNTVEILEGFEDNPIIAKVLTSSKIAINLTLKEEYKNIWFGNATLGIGTKDRFKFSSNIGLIRKEIKLFNFNNINNLGNYAREQINNTNVEYNDHFYSNISEEEIDPIYSLPEIQVPFFRNNETTFNKALINSLSFVKSINNNLKIRGTGYYLKDNETFSSNSQTVFKTDPPITYFETQRLKNKSPLIGGSLEIKYGNNKNSYVKNTLNIKNESTNINQDLIFNDDIIQQKIKNKKVKFYNHLNHTLLVKKNLIHNYFYFGFNDLNQNLNLISPTLNNLFSQPANSEIKNKADDSSTIIGGKSSFLIKKKNIENIYEVGYENLIIKRKNLFKLDNNTEIDTLENLVNYKQSKLMLNSRLRYLLTKNIEFYGSISFDYLNINSHNNQKNELLLNPKIGLRLKNLKIGTFNFQYQKDYKIPPYNIYLTNFQLSNYQSFIKGINNISIYRNDKYRFSYNVSNDLQTQSLALSSQYIKSNGGYSYSNLINENFSYNISNLVGSSTTLISKIDFTSYFKKLKLSTNFGAFLNITNTPLLINSSDFNNLNLSTVSYFLSGRTYFKSNFNLNFNLNLLKTKSKYNNIYSKTNWKSISLDLNYKISDLFITSMTSKFYFIKSETYSFINIDCIYNPKNSRFSYQFLLNNLNNENKFILDYIDETSSHNTMIKLLPRYVFFSVKYRF